MNRRKRSRITRQKSRRPGAGSRKTTGDEFQQRLSWFLPQSLSLAQGRIHGNVKWCPVQLVWQALIWSWQETRNVTDAFVQGLEICSELGLTKVTCSYTAFMNALDRYGHVLLPELRLRFQALAEEVGERYFEIEGWVLIAFDGSRVTAPRTVSNERAFCAPGYGTGKRARYGKKKSKGMRRRRNEQNKPHPQVPQVWITMLWHMGLRLPWTWRLGPSNSSEREHVGEILAVEKFPENTLFCGDAGFVGYPLWSAIVAMGGHFLVRVGANVQLLSQNLDVKRIKGGVVLCWPKHQQVSGKPPLCLRLLCVKVGKTKMWMLTSVLDREKLSRKAIVRFYKMRWGVELEFRGLKQTIDKHTLRCRNPRRLLVELDWSLRGMAVAQLFALHAQISRQPDKPLNDDPKDRSLANTMRVLRDAMRNLNASSQPGDRLMDRLARARIQRYSNRTDKRARYRPKNPDKKPLGDPTIRKLTPQELRLLRQHPPTIAA